MFFSKTGGMKPSASTLLRLARSMHERWQDLGPETTASIRDAGDIPHDAVSASVSLDGVMVALRAGEAGRAEACWREAPAARLPRRRGQAAEDPHLGRMPESGKLTLKAQLAGEVAQIRRLRPGCAIAAIADGAADNWTFLQTLAPEAEASTSGTPASISGQPPTMR